MVVGETDTGKSTLCAYLSNIAIGEGIVPCVVDGDIGQGDLAPPSAIGGTVIEGQITDLRDLSANSFEFVGRISPVGIERIVSEKLRSMLHKLSPLRQMCIVNTDGYVDDGGLVYKRMIADSLRPDVIIFIGQNQPLIDSLASDSWQIVLARQSVHARKSVFERSQRRSDQIQKFIGTGLYQVDPSEIAFVYLDKTYSFSQLPALNAWQQDGRLTNIFVGLGSRNEVAGFGVMEHADESVLQVRTDIKQFSTLYLSDITLPASHSKQVKMI
jgi:polynucleotide 5'-hydroxyl-kinase GRC3/NOL9